MYKEFAFSDVKLKSFNYHDLELEDEEIVGLLSPQLSILIFCCRAKENVSKVPNHSFPVWFGTHVRKFFIGYIEKNYLKKLSFDMNYVFSFIHFYSKLFAGIFPGTSPRIPLKLFQKCLQWLH